MKFRLLIDLTYEERKAVQAAFRTVGLLELKKEDEAQRKMLTAIRMVGEGKGITEDQMELALEALRDLWQITKDMSEWTPATFGMDRHVPRMKKVVTKVVSGKGPLGSRLPKLEVTEESEGLPLIVNPPKFFEDMADLRRSQLTLIDEAIGVLEPAMERISMMGMLNSYIDRQGKTPEEMEEAEIEEDD